jgi:hypothetical protein
MRRGLVGYMRITDQSPSLARDGVRGDRGVSDTQNLYVSPKRTSGQRGESLFWGVTSG